MMSKEEAKIDEDGILVSELRPPFSLNEHFNAKEASIDDDRENENEREIRPKGIRSKEEGDLLISRVNNRVDDLFAMLAQLEMKRSQRSKDRIDRLLGQMQTKEGELGLELEFTIAHNE